jgi:hypothetical protein
VLHSLSGTMAISETVLKDTVLMAIDEINAKGGLLGKKLEPVVVDPASNWPLFAEKAKQLITRTRWPCVRLLDLGVAQVGAAGLRRKERCCSTRCSTRVKSCQQERVLHRRRAQPAGHSRGRIPDEQGRRLAPSASCCWAPTTCTRAPPTRSCAPS